MGLVDLKEKPVATGKSKAFKEEKKKDKDKEATVKKVTKSLIRFTIEDIELPELSYHVRLLFIPSHVWFDIDQILFILGNFGFVC